MPQIRLLSISSSNQLFKHFDKLFSKLNEILPNEKPALIHGDLWNGNFNLAEYQKENFPELKSDAENHTIQ